MTTVYGTLNSAFARYIGSLNVAAGYRLLHEAGVGLSTAGFSYFGLETRPPASKQSPGITHYAAYIDHAWDLFSKGDRASALAIAEDCVQTCDVADQPKTRLMALLLAGRINVDKAIESGKRGADGTLRSADDLLTAALALAVTYHAVSAFMMGVHEKARVALQRYHLFEAEMGFRLALAYYIHAGALNNVDAALRCLHGVAECYLQFSRGPTDAVHLLDSLQSTHIRSKDDTGYEFLEIRSLAIYALVMVNHKAWLAKLVRKGLNLRKSLPPLSDLALEEAAIVDRHHGGAHVSVLREHLPTSNRVLRDRPFKQWIEPPTGLQRPHFSSPGEAAANLSILYDYLSEQDKQGSYVYRGQTRDYDGPLLPSTFRRAFAQSSATDYRMLRTPDELDFRLRKCGSAFVGEYNESARRYADPLKRLVERGADDSELRAARDVYGRAADPMVFTMAQQLAPAVSDWADLMRSYLSPAEQEVFEANCADWRPLVAESHRSLYRDGAFLSLFGYALGTTIAQQYGLASAGLDATKRLEVACFFASHSPSDFQTRPEEGVGIIYRFPYRPSDIARRQIRDYSFYTMPSIVDLEDIVYRFEKPKLMLEDSLRLFDYYFGHTFANLYNDLDLLFLPEGFYDTTRLCRQGAMLIFPDELRWEEADGYAGADGIRPSRFRYIENLAAREGVDKFYFRHSSAALQGPGAVVREDLWPRDDELLKFVVGIMTARYPLTHSKPKRLDLLDGGYDQEQFVAHCARIAEQYRLDAYDANSVLASSFGTIVI